MIKELLEMYGVLMTLCLSCHANPDNQSRALKMCAVEMRKNPNLSSAMNQFLLNLTKQQFPLGYYSMAVRKVSEVCPDSPLSIPLLKGE